MRERARSGAGLVLLLSLAACGTGTERTPLSAAAQTCVYVTDVRGDHYFLAYAGHECSRTGYAALPEERYHDLASWSFNTQSAGILSALDNFRVEARLASHDTSSSHGFSVHALFWSEYGWNDKAAQAYLTALDVLGHGPLIEGILERPLIEGRFGRQGDDWVEMRHRPLSRRDRTRLVHLFANAEDTLGTIPSMTLRRHTLEEAANAIPEYASARRETFSWFTLDTLPDPKLP